MPSISPALRALFADSVDYAGLFPPAGLALESALENHAGYARGDDAWMLGRFVQPIARLSETGPLLARWFDHSNPLRISALGSKADSAVGFQETLRANLQALAALSSTYSAALSIEQFESSLPQGMKPGSEIQQLLSDAAGLIETILPDQMRIFWEIPFSDRLSEMMHCIADHNAQVSPTNLESTFPCYQADGRLIHHPPMTSTAHRQPFGVKLRTGGMEAAAFSTCRQVADALIAARDAGVALKFTAGLHHPLRHFDVEIGTRMHGFLNVYAAGILVREHRLDAEETTAILEDERSDNFRFDADGFEWCDRRVSTNSLAAHRKFITSFGSCSFVDPRDDLRSLGLMS